MYRIEEITHQKTKELHEKYVSKILPDCGKYGDAAKFIAEMAPGVAEYNAIREGDWKEFAIAAGLDITAVGIGAATAGAGYAAIKSGSAVAKNGTKLAIKEIAEAGTKKVVKETAGATTEKIVKETVGTAAEKVAKEMTETIVEKTEKELGENTIEIVEKTVLKVGDKIDKTRFSDYMKEIEKITTREITTKQRCLIEKALKEKDYVKLSVEDRRVASREFNRVRSDLIKEWEKMTNQKWPCYTKDVINDAGVVIRKAGQPFDAHHIIELSTGGPNKWWNLHPASFPDEHLKKIHGAGSFARKIFG